MRVLFTFLFTVCLTALQGQIVCNQNGNLIIYSNYDGGIVTINVDQNIPNLKIGICTYEPVQVSFTGPFVGNVTEVVYGGFNSIQGSDNCLLGDFPTSITGVDASIVSINTNPAVGYPNPNGWPNLVGVAGACSSTQNAGGANTPDQVVYYFEQVTGGIFYAHLTQYNCWINTVYNVSDGGNCCVVPTSSCVAPVADAGADVTICPGGSASIGGAPTASGGSSSNYTYSWSPAAGLSDPTVANPVVSPLSDQTYTVTVSNGNVNCSSTSSVDVSIGSTQTLPVTVIGSLLLCPNETLELQADPGFTNYLWSTTETSSSIVVSAAGSFSVSAESVTGCPAVSAVYTVTQDVPFAVSVTPSEDVQLCGNETVLLSAQAGLSNYVWSNNVTGASLLVSQSGGYSVSAENVNGCPGTSAIVTVQVDPAPVSSFIYNQLDEYTVQFTCTDPNATAWLWDFGSGNTSTLENPQYDFLFDNDWPVSLIVTNACGSDTLNELVTVIKSGIRELFDTPIRLISGADYIQLMGNATEPIDVQIAVYTALGQRMESQTRQLKSEWQITFSTASYSAGIYFIVLHSNAGNAYVKWTRK